MKPTFLFKFHNIFYEKHVHIQFLIKKPSLVSNDSISFATTCTRRRKFAIQINAFYAHIVNEIELF